MSPSKTFRGAVTYEHQAHQPTACSHMSDSCKWGVHIPFGPYTTAVWVGGSEEDWVCVGEGGEKWTREKGCNGLAAGGAESGGCGGGDVDGGKKGQNGKRAKDAHPMYIGWVAPEGVQSGGSCRHPFGAIWDLLDSFWLGFKPKVRTLIFQACQ